MWSQEGWSFQKPSLQSFCPRFPKEMGLGLLHGSNPKL